jgi:hypothetical protein
VFEGGVKFLCRLVFSCPKLVYVKYVMINLLLSTCKSIHSWNENRGYSDQTKTKTHVKLIEL